MIQKLKIFLFSMTFIACSAFSTYAMDPEDKSEIPLPALRAAQTWYLEKTEPNPVKLAWASKRDQLPRVFPELYTLFIKTPYHLREDAWKRVACFHPYSKREAPQLYEYYYDQEDNLRAIRLGLGDFPQGTRSLKQELFGLPYNPKFGE